MNKIQINIGQSSDGTFGAYAENIEGVYGMGNSAELAKKEALIGLEIMKKTASNQLPQWILEGHYEIEYRLSLFF